jgi:aspartate aminotransferase-like enzyme
MLNSIELQTIINLGGAALLASIGWFARQVWEATQQLKADLHALEVDLPKTYVSKDDFSDTMKHIEDMFQRIYDKLDGKADK